MSVARSGTPAGLIAIGLGGSLGSLARYALDPGLIYMTGAPVAVPTFIVNVSGSLIIGLLFAVIVERSILPANLRGPLMIGFVGSYTTFATVALAGWRMIELGQLVSAVANLAGSLLAGMVAVVIGVWLGRLLSTARQDGPEA
jgi:fluoride exporter